MVWHQLFRWSNNCGVSGKKKNDTLTGNFGFVGNKMAFTLGKFNKIKSHFITYKSNANTSYLTTKLIKQLP
jgi:hypothetical protein